MDRLVLKKSAYSLLPPFRFENVSVKLYTHSQQNACDIGLRLNLRLHLTLMRRSSLQNGQPTAGCPVYTGVTNKGR